MGMSTLRRDVTHRLFIPYYYDYLNNSIQGTYCGYPQTPSVPTHRPIYRSRLPKARTARTTVTVQYKRAYHTMAGLGIEVTAKGVLANC